MIVVDRSAIFTLLLEIRHSFATPQIILPEMCP